MPSTRRRTYSVIAAFRAVSRTRARREKDLSKAIKRLKRRWHLTDKQTYSLEKNLSRIPRYLRYLKHIQLEILQQHPDLTPQQFWRAYNERIIDRSLFSFPESTKMDITSKSSWRDVERRGRPVEPSAPLAGYLIRKIASITGKFVSFARPNPASNRVRPPYGPAVDVIRCALKLNLYAIPTPSDETIAKWIQETRKRPEKIPPDPPFGKSRTAGL